MNHGKVMSIDRDHSMRDVRRHVNISHIHVARSTTTDTIIGKMEGSPTIDTATTDPSNIHHAHEQVLKNSLACPRSLEAV